MSVELAVCCDVIIALHGYCAELEVISPLTWMVPGYLTRTKAAFSL